MLLRDGCARRRTRDAERARRVRYERHVRHHRRPKRGLHGRARLRLRCSIRPQSGGRAKGDRPRGEESRLLQLRERAVRGRYHRGVRPRLAPLRREVAPAGHGPRWRSRRCISRFRRRSSRRRRPGRPVRNESPRTAWLRPVILTAASAQLCDVRGRQRRDDRGSSIKFGNGAGAVVNDLRHHTRFPDNALTNAVRDRNRQPVCFNWCIRRFDGLELLTGIERVGDAGENPRERPRGRRRARREGPGRDNDPIRRVHSGHVGPRG